jgi:hypothetical protein
MSANKETALFTVDGRIQALHVTAGIANLLESLQRGAGFTGMISGLMDQPGAMANAASLVMYDGEDVEHVAMIIDSKPAIGTFEWVHDLNVGNEVTLVVSEMENGWLFVHAILRLDDLLLWTPSSINRTRYGWTLHAIKLATTIVSLTWLLFGVFFLFDRTVLQTPADWYWIIFGPIVLMLFATTMSTVGIMHLGEEAEAIFRALCVPKFARFKIKPYSLRRLYLLEDPNAQRKGSIYSFSKALAAHKKRYRLV